MRKKIRARKAKQAQSINKIIAHLSELVQHDENFILKLAGSQGDMARLLKDLRERNEALDKRVTALEKKKKRRS